MSIGYTSLKASISPQFPDMNSVILDSTSPGLIDEIADKIKSVYAACEIVKDEMASGHSYRLDVKNLDKKYKSKGTFTSYKVYFWIIDILCSHNWEPFAATGNEIHFRSVQ